MEAQNHDQEDEDEGFYFESEELALKNNTDYQSLLRTIAILQAQQAQTLKDIDKLANMKVDALKNPQDFIEKLVRNENMFPERLNIAIVPKIDFSKYQGHAPFTPQEIPVQDDEVTVQNGDSNVDLLKSSITLRHWTVDEQKKLEDLLAQYPPEEVERRRFEKIARALGNRTVQQVASRCQKYFKKLQMAGLPIPGRYPKGRQFYRPQPNMSCFSGRKTTFFPDLDVPVKMNENEDAWLKETSVQSPQDDDSSQDNDKYTTIDDTTDDEAEEQDTKAATIKLARRIRADKERDLEDRPTSLHIGFKCDICQEDPIRGTRWHCKVCEKSIDYCSDCIFTQLTQPNLQHPRSHKFIAFRVTNNNT